MNKKDDVARQIVINLVRRWKLAKKIARVAKRTYPDVVWVGYALVEIEAWNSLQAARDIYYSKGNSYEN